MDYIPVCLSSNVWKWFFCIFYIVFSSLRWEISSLLICFHWKWKLYYIFLKDFHKRLKEKRRFQELNSPPATWKNSLMLTSSFIHDVKAWYLLYYAYYIPNFMVIILFLFIELVFPLTQWSGCLLLPFTHGTK